MIPMKNLKLNKVTQVLVNARGEVTVVVTGGLRQLVEFGIAMASQCSYSPASSTATILHEKTDNILGGELRHQPNMQYLFFGWNVD